MTTQPDTTRTSTKRLTATAAALAAAGLAVLAPSTASAAIDQNPNAIPFGPAICEGGLTPGVAYSPTEPATVGMDLESGIKGVSKSLSVIVVTGDDPLIEHVVVQQLSDKPGKGYEKNTVLCVWPYDPDNGIWLAADIMFNGATRH